MCLPWKKTSDQKRPGSATAATNVRQYNANVDYNIVTAYLQLGIYTIFHIIFKKVKIFFLNNCHSHHVFEEDDR